MSLREALSKMGRFGDAITLPVIGVVLLVALVTVAVLIPTVFGFGTPIGDSTYTGVVVDVQHEEGLVWQTSQVVAKSNAEASDQQAFCMVNPSDSGLLEKSRNTLNDGERVKIQYHRPLWIPLWECPNGALIMDDIEPIGGDQ